MEKKNLLKAMLCGALSFATVFGTAACGGGTSAGNSTSEGNKTEYISADPLTFDGFDNDYLPDKTKIQKREGTIRIALDFDGTQDGWQALADEYMRLQGDGVLIDVNSDLSGDAYSKKLQTMAQTPETAEWDIVQGNLLPNTSTSCVDMYGYLYQPNAYCGADNEAWMDVLDSRAYTMETIASSSTYIINTESVNTAWFVNKVAMEEAGKLGYKNASGKVDVPETWDDIISLCDYMKQAGYEDPLGISLDQASVESNQFTWLERIYGDYYYRNEYVNILKDNVAFEYKPDDTNPEQYISENTMMRSRLFNCILDDDASNTYYVGARSPKFKDYLTQLGKLKPYITSFNAAKSQEKMRNEFQTQSYGKKSPQIMLDYLGCGMAFQASETDDFKVDFFDYPPMVSEFITDGRIVRDVGGSGGWLSVFKRGDKAQIELCVDFIKFVMSPYGQSVYYKAIQEKKYSPRGLTLVDTDLVCVPESWKEFFNSDKIVFNGLVDTNEFVRNLIRSFCADSEAKSTIISCYQKFLTDASYGVNEFSEEWHSTMIKRWPTVAKARNWNPDGIKDRTKDLNEK